MGRKSRHRPHLPQWNRPHTSVTSASHGASATQTFRIRFAEFEVDLQSQELFRDGAPVRLPNQSFQALAALLERPGQLVTREELRTRLWPDKRVVEFEQGLNAIINRLREALGDSAESPKFIETLPRRGYRFVGSLATAADSALPATPVEATADTQRSHGCGRCRAAFVWRPQPSSQWSHWASRWPRCAGCHAR